MNTTPHTLKERYFECNEKKPQCHLFQHVIIRYKISDNRSDLISDINIIIWHNKDMIIKFNLIQYSKVCFSQRTTLLNVIDSIIRIKFTYHWLKSHIVLYIKSTSHLQALVSFFFQTTDNNTCYYKRNKKKWNKSH